MTMKTFTSGSSVTLFILLLTMYFYSQAAMEYNNRGISVADLEDYKGAIHDFNKAIELNSMC